MALTINPRSRMSRFLPPPGEPVPITIQEAREIATLRALAYTNGNIEWAAHYLGVTRMTVYNLMKARGLTP